MTKVFVFQPLQFTLVLKDYISYSNFREFIIAYDIQIISLVALLYFCGNYSIYKFIPLV